MNLFVDLNQYLVMRFFEFYNITDKNSIKMGLVQKSVDLYDFKLFIMKDFFSVSSTFIEIGTNCQR